MAFDPFCSIAFPSDAGDARLTCSADALSMANAPAALIARAIVNLQSFITASRPLEMAQKLTAVTKTRQQTQGWQRRTPVECFGCDLGETKASAMTVSLQFTRRAPRSKYMGRPVRFCETVIQVYISSSTTSAGLRSCRRIAGRLAPRPERQTVRRGETPRVACPCRQPRQCGRNLCRPRSSASSSGRPISAERYRPL